MCVLSVCKFQKGAKANDLDSFLAIWIVDLSEHPAGAQQ